MSNKFSKPPILAVLSREYNRHAFLETPALGLEIEVEYARSPERQLKYWQVTTDGSLRNEGLEFLSRGPIPFADAEPAILEYLKVIEESGAKHNKHNYRTSIHCHINVYSMTVAQLQRLVHIYLLSEAAFFRMGGEVRRSSPYCVALNDAHESFKLHANFALQKMPNGNDAAYKKFHRYASMVNNSNLKYCAFGTFRLKDLGTVELRMHEGTNDPDRLKLLVRAAKQLYKYAVDTLDVNICASRLIQMIAPYRKGGDDPEFKLAQLKMQFIDDAIKVARGQPLTKRRRHGPSIPRRPRRSIPLTTAPSEWVISDGETGELISQPAQPINAVPLDWDMGEEMGSASPADAERWENILTPQDSVRPGWNADAFAAMDNDQRVAYIHSMRELELMANRPGE